jgi:hypothetical protein
MVHKSQTTKLIKLEHQTQRKKLCNIEGGVILFFFVNDGELECQILRVT